MRQVKLASALLLSLTAGALVMPVAQAAEKCPMEKRQSRAVGETVGKKVQKSFEAYTNGQVDEAIAILLEANAKGDFDKAYVARMLGNFYAEKGKMDTAIKYMKQAVEADVLGGTDHAASMKLYADLLIQEKKWKEAIAIYYKWMDFACKTDDPVVYRRIGIAYSELKQWDKVLEVADQGLSHAKEPDKNLYQMKLTAYFEKKQYKNAVKVLETMVPLFQDDKRLWIQLAQFYLLTEDFPRSLQTYDLSYRNGFLKEDAGSLVRYSQLLASQGSPYRAATIMEKFMKAGVIESNAKHYEQLAGFFQNSKEIEKAAEYYGKAAEEKKDGKLFLKQGRMLALAEKYSAAVPALEKSLDAGIPNPGEAHFELALIHLQLKQYKSAYSRAKLAAQDKKTERSAKSYISYIQEKARINNVTL
ncbi:tetratricopeptide repeat protein [Shewanella zhangzhouensis]|uniref:tetratricopeptide repeat protein n=1 Tax=Shewanella zhangzhouensis TaxID=2864213 RepID=UPI001C65B426|nr:tetratricopeptide repeat protein [Shewanella zhangzhouensis]QYK06521.1 tetratricopeptide repeat protein [Shewanella zhangzhouensis]